MLYRLANRWALAALVDVDLRSPETLPTASDRQTPSDMQGDD